MSDPSDSVHNGDLENRSAAEEVASIRARIRMGIAVAKPWIGDGTMDKVANAYVVHTEIFAALDPKAVISVAAAAVVELALRERGL